VAQDSDADAIRPQRTMTRCIALEIRNETLLLPEMPRNRRANDADGIFRRRTARRCAQGRTSRKQDSTTPAFLERYTRKSPSFPPEEDNPTTSERELLERLENAGVRVLRDGPGWRGAHLDGRQKRIYSCFVACPDAPNGRLSKSAEAPDQQQDISSNRNPNAACHRDFFCTAAMEKEL